MELLGPNEGRAFFCGEESGAMEREPLNLFDGFTHRVTIDAARNYCFRNPERMEEFTGCPAVDCSGGLKRDQ